MWRNKKNSFSFIFLSLLITSPLIGMEHEKPSLKTLCLGKYTFTQDTKDPSFFECGLFTLSDGRRYIHYVHINVPDGTRDMLVYDKWKKSRNFFQERLGTGINIQEDAAVCPNKDLNTIHDAFFELNNGTFKASILNGE